MLRRQCEIFGIHGVALPWRCPLPVTAASCALGGSRRLQHGEAWIKQAQERGGEKGVWEGRGKEGVREAGEKEEETKERQNMPLPATCQLAIAINHIPASVYYCIS